MRYFHRTTRKAATAILRGGFRDATGTYLTAQRWTGVWISDVPLDCNNGADGDALLAIEIDGRKVSPCEWKEEGQSHREFLVPERILNAHAIVIMIDAAGQIDLTRLRRPP